MTVPKRRNAAGFTLARQGITRGSDDLAWIRADQEVGTLGDGDGALGIFTQGEAGDAESRGFFLDAAGIGEHEAGFAQETEKIEVPNGRNEPKLRMMLDTALCQTLLRAGMHGENNGHFGCNGINRTQKLAELFRRIDVGRTMKGQDTEALPAGAILQCQIFTDC